MNSENGKTSKPQVLWLDVTDKIDLQRGKKPLLNLSIYDTWKNIKSSYNNNKFKISAPTWNAKFELPDGNSVSNIQDYFEHIFQKHRENTDNLLIRLYVNKIENRIIFKINF